MSKPTQYWVDDKPNPYSGDDPDSMDSQPHQPNSPKKKPWLMIATIVVVILILVGGLLYFLEHKPAKPKAQITGQKIIQVAPSNTSSTTTKYVSNGTDLNLSFSYPDNWTVVPASNNNKSDQTITLTSPLTTIVNANNSSVVGKIIVQVRPGTATISELNSNSPIAALASAQIAYSKPTPSQTSYPYLSYIHFSDGSKPTGSFEEVIITGSLTLTQGQTINASYFGGLDPIISASFYQCATQSCTGSSQSLLSITSNTWQNATIFKQVLATLDSFQLN